MLDKGIVIAGDVKVKLVDIELLTIQLRLVICSIDKAKEMGMDWWANSSVFQGDRDQKALDEETSRTTELEQQVQALQAKLAEVEAEAKPQEPRRFSPIPTPPPGM
ncbi:MAG: gas vesicle protein [Planctomycetota bacterium]